MAGKALAAWRQEVTVAERFTGDHDRGFVGRDFEDLGAAGTAAPA
jgi:hypothetical protein